MIVRLRYGSSGPGTMLEHKVLTKSHILVMGFSSFQSSRSTRRPGFVSCTGVPARQPLDIQRKAVEMNEVKAKVRHKAYGSVPLQQARGRRRWRTGPQRSCSSSWCLTDIAAIACRSSFVVWICAIFVSCSYYDQDTGVLDCHGNCHVSWTQVQGYLCWVDEHKIRTPQSSCTSSYCARVPGGMDE